MIKATEKNYHLLDDNVQSIVDSVLTKVSNRNDKFSIDPFTIIAIINCIISVIRLLYACYSKRSDLALQSLRRPNFIQKILIKRQIKKYAEREYVTDIYESMKEHSHNMDKDDILHLINLYDSQQFFKKEED